MAWCIPGPWCAENTSGGIVGGPPRRVFYFQPKDGEQDIHQGRWAIIRQSREVRTIVTTELVSRELFYRDKSFWKSRQRHERILRRDRQIGEPCWAARRVCKGKETCREHERKVPRCTLSPRPALVRTRLSLNVLLALFWFWYRDARDAWPRIATPSCREHRAHMPSNWVPDQRDQAALAVL